MSLSQSPIGYCVMQLGRRDTHSADRKILKEREYIQNSAYNFDQEENESCKNIKKEQEECVIE